MTNREQIIQKRLQELESNIDKEIDLILENERRLLIRK